MRASILVKDEKGRIQQRFDSSVDEATVKKVVEMLERRYPNHKVDTSQIELARKAREHLIELDRGQIDVT